MSPQIEACHPMTLDETAARLEGLLERATKGPFDFMEGLNLIRALRGDLAVPLFEIREPYCDPEMAIPTVRLDGKVVSRANSMAARDTASIRQGRANGRFLLEVLNALPALLSERRALREALQAYVKAYDEGTGTIHVNKKIRAALLTANGGEHD